MCFSTKLCNPMLDITPDDADGQRQPELPAHVRLLRLARQVERLGTSGRTDPETVVLSKLGIAAELRRLAAAMEVAR